MLCIESGAMLSGKEVAVDNAFAVGLELPCLEPRTPVDHLVEGHPTFRHRHA